MVAVGVVSTAKYFAPRALAGFLAHYPAVELRLVTGNRAEIIDGLRRLEIDVAIMGRPPGDLDVVREVMGDHPHVVIARPDHPLARLAAIAPAALTRETFLTREPGSGTLGLMERFFADANIAPRIGMRISSNETIKQAVIAGLGIAFISAHTIDAELQEARLALLAVRGLPVVRQWFAVRLRDRPLIPAAARLHDFLKTDGRQYLPRIEAYTPAVA